LPGSEGAGVADVLFGKRPFSGRLPVSWPRTEAQQPLNVGDASYDPQYPYGWGLTTQAAARQKLTEARDTLLREHDPYALAAGIAAGVALQLKDWSGPQATIALAAIAQSAKYLERTKADAFGADDAVVGAARWIAQNKIGQALDEPASKLTSDAEHQLLTGHLSAAVSNLTAAYRLR
jgi:beta-glucosidase